VLCKRSILVGSLVTNDGPRPGALPSPTLGAAVIPPWMSEQPTVRNRSDASTISDLDHDEAASMGAPPLPPWPTPTNASGARPGSSHSTRSTSTGTVLERSFSSKRKRDGDEDTVSGFLIWIWFGYRLHAFCQEDPFAMPSSSSTSVRRPLFGTSRIELLEKRVAEAETKMHEQQATIEQQIEQIARQNDALKACEAANRILQGRMDRLEMHVAAMETRLELHNQLLYDSPPE